MKMFLALVSYSGQIAGCSPSSITLTPPQHISQIMRISIDGEWRVIRRNLGRVTSVLEVIPAEQKFQLLSGRIKEVSETRGGIYTRDHTRKGLVCDKGELDWNVISQCSPVQQARNRIPTAVHDEKLSEIFAYAQRMAFVGKNRCRERWIRRRWSTVHVIDVRSQG